MHTTSAHAVTEDHAARARGTGVLAAIAAHADSRPDHIAACAVQSSGNSVGVLSYACLAHSSAALAATLDDIITAGDVVVLMGPSCPQFIIWLCACLKCGARVFPVHPHSTAVELRAACERSAAVAMIAGNDSLAALDLPIPRLTFDLVLAKKGAVRESTHAACSGAVILQSSGTTGMPKLVLRDDAALDAVAANVASALALSPDDCVLAAMPLCHSYGVDIALATLLAGASLHIVDTFDPPIVAEQLTSQVTVFPGVPFMFEAMGRIALQRQPARLRMAFSAGTPLPLRVGESFQARWGRAIGQLYGATELGSVTFNDPKSPSFAPGSVGAPMNGVRIRIVDPAEPSRRLAAGIEGHVAIWAPSMLRGYLGDDLQLSDLHFLTGDLGSVDERGNLFITGRLKLLIDVGGLKVNPLEVEAALATHPAVKECAVVPLKLSDTVTRLRAVVVVREQIEPPTADRLRMFLRRLISPHKVPRVFDCVSSLPRSSSGKLLRHLIAGHSC